MPSAKKEEHDENDNEENDEQVNAGGAGVDASISGTTGRVSWWTIIGVGAAAAVVVALLYRMRCDRNRRQRTHDDSVDGVDANGKCENGLTRCDGECTDTKKSEKHCGKCGDTCNGKCVDGVCMVKNGKRKSKSVFGAMNKLEAKNRAAARSAKAAAASA